MELLTFWHICQTFAHSQALVLPVYLTLNDSSLLSRGLATSTEFTPLLDTFIFVFHCSFVAVEGLFASCTLMDAHPRFGGLC